jgi:hypothetical protein
MALHVESTVAGSKTSYVVGCGGYLVLPSSCWLCLGVQTSRIWRRSKCLQANHSCNTLMV